MDLYGFSAKRNPQTEKLDTLCVAKVKKAANWYHFQYHKYSLKRSVKSINYNEYIPRRHAVCIEEIELDNKIIISLPNSKDFVLITSTRQTIFGGERRKSAISYFFWRTRGCFSFQ